ncbi:MAG TPA: TIM44-like domain-containing protein, partial [Bdellovibrio sp.]|nr:TIM44-like domain-containing protein [Bdellovibrio sp.]
MKKKNLSAALLMLFCGQVFARAGGAGGGHSSGSFGGGSNSYGGYSHGGNYGTGYGGGGGTIDPLTIFLMIALVVIIIVVLSKAQSRNAGSSYEVSPDPDNFKPAPLDMSALGGDTPDDISRKVATAFMLIQQAWSQKRLDMMRRFITDGVYQRFNAQMTMMKILTQTNTISNVHIQRMNIAKSYQEGGYDCIDLRIQAVATDQFVCEKYSNLRSPGGTESFVEYWSFIRRHDHKKGFDIYHSETCPQCSAPLSGKLMENARCPYCSTYLNSGEYDWVLSEITQSDQYGSSFVYMFSLPPMKGTPLSEVIATYPAFSTQVLEDRAS